ncbi:3'-5' exonuclease [Oleoguttula sp. CCFEE 5521]
MPGLELSSNWKILQGRLEAGKKAEAKINGGVKRQRPEDPKFTRPRPYSRGPKATGDNSIPLTKERKMGSSMSSAPVPAERHATLAKDHDIDPSDIHAAFDHSASSSAKVLPNDARNDEINAGLHPTNKPGKYLSLDCEMVGTGPPPHADHLLARVSLVNYHGQQIYDSYVQTPAGTKVTDYRTSVSGIRPHHLLPDTARPFAEVQRTVSDLLETRVLVGHALKKDLEVLELKHRPRDVRDTSRYSGYRIESKGKPPALRKLAASELGWKIQEGEHSSIEDARAAMGLFRKRKGEIEGEVVRKYGKGGPGGAKKKEQESKAGAAELGEDDEDGEGDDEEEDEELETLDGEDDDVASKTGPVQVKKKRKKKKNTRRK